MLKKVGQEKVVILGMGNLLRGDDGIGAHFVRMLNKDDLDCDNLEIIEGGICPEFASFVEDADKLIIVDAIRGGKEPGTIYRLGIDDVAMDLAARLSVHQLGLVDSLKILRILGREPRHTIIIGIEPKNIDCRLELSPEVKKGLAELRKIVMEEIKKTKLLPRLANS